MKKIDKIESTFIVLAADDIDTDQIIPARFLKRVSKSGFGEFLFYDWRFDHNGEQIKNVALNIKSRSFKILVAGNNFGCGSSREHAAWALKDYGFDAVLAPSFADIFYNNALNNGIIPVVSPRYFYQKFLEDFSAESEEVITIELSSQTVTYANEVFKFNINAYKKECLLNGLDDISYLLSVKQEINDYELQSVFS